MKPLKVLLILPDNVSGTGSGTYADTLVRGLKDRKEIEARVYSSDIDLNEKVDVVHAVDLKHFDPDIAPPDVPLIVDAHDAYWKLSQSIFPTPDLPLRIYFALKRTRKYAPIFDRAAAIIAHSQHVADEIGLSKVRVIPYPIENISPGPPLSERPLRVLFAGRDYFRKGLPVLAAAWQIVGKRKPAAKLIIAGREFIHGRIFAKALTLDKSIEWIGDVPREKILDEMRSARALVLPSFQEAFGIVLSEAAAAGTPAIATRVGGIPEALQYGILVDRGDIRGLAAAILKCLNDKTDEAILRTQIKTKERNNFSLENILTKTIGVYSEVANLK